jgi:hypothetical protein
MNELGETDDARSDETQALYDKDDLGIPTLFFPELPLNLSNAKVKALEQWVKQQLATDWWQVFDRGFI